MQTPLPPDDRLPDRAYKGRGAVGNPAPRFDRLAAEAVDDGWERQPGDEPPLRTTVLPDTARTLICRNDSPDIPLEQSVNPYKGCEHGCVYCFARPNHAYLGLSPGLDFETRLFAKFNAAAVLDGELRSPRYRCRPIAIGTNTDAYQPVERELRITRGIWEVLSAFNHPAALVTKSALVMRDLDILADMAARRLVQVGISVTTLNPDTARTLEPRAAAPHRRLDAIAALSRAGVPVTVMAAPLIPGLTDHELDAILTAARDAGAVGAAYILVRLPHEVKDLMRAWLDTHTPNRTGKVLGLIRDCHGGKLYAAEFGRRFTGHGVYADLLRARFHAACRRLGLNARNRDSITLDCTRFAPPPRAGDQLALF